MKKALDSRPRALLERNSSMVRLLSLSCKLDSNSPSGRAKVLLMTPAYLLAIRSSTRTTLGIAVFPCCATRYHDTMITSFRHKGLRKYFESGSLAGIQPAHASRLKMQLAALDTAHTIEDMDIPGFRLHPLKGSERGRWSIWVNSNWRVTFEFENGNALILDYEDYQ